MENQADLSVYWEVLKRRKWLFILPAAVVFLLAAVISFSLPPKYTSEATILVEAQEIPEDIVQSSVTGYVEERLQSIQQVVLSRSNLLDIVERYDLYPEMREEATTGEVVAYMQNHISLEPVQAEGGSSGSGRKDAATIAFTLAYEGNEPEKAAQVADTLASQFIEENSRQREQTAETAVDFLQFQVNQLQSALQETEQEIAEFKDENLLALPQMTQLNMDNLHRVQEEIDRQRRNIQQLKDRKIYLEGQLATIDPFSQSSERYRAGGDDSQWGMSPQQRLENLRSRHTSMKASRSSEHPDVIDLRKQIQALEGAVQAQEELRSTRQELQSRKSELAELQERYSEHHPDVRQMQKEVQELRQAVGEQELRQDALYQEQEQEQPENPSYIELQTRVESTSMEIESAQESLQDLRDKQQEYQQRLEKTPKVEQEFNTVQRKYEHLKQQYSNVQDRLMDAKESQQLERDQASQKLRLVDAPSAPEQPSSPNRMALLLIGAVLASGIGVGTGSLSEYLDRSVYDSDALARYTQMSVLASVPYLWNSQDASRRLRRRLAVIIGLILVLIAGLSAIHFLVSPLDILWLQLQDRLQDLF